jgi:hypothetical protein
MVCVPVAVFLGYLLANPLDYSTMALYGILALLLCFPLLLRWHNWLLLLFWNLSMNLFFLQGVAAAMAGDDGVEPGLISVLQRTLSRQSQFVKVPEITLAVDCLWPWWCWAPPN